MHDYFLILVGSVLVQNFVLSQFLGLCPFMGVSRKLDSATSMGLATAFVLALSAALSHLVRVFLLEPFDLEYLRTPAFILVIAAVVQFTELMLRKTSPLLHRVLGIYLPLITTNCAVLGVALLNAREDRGFIEAILFGAGAGFGFALVLWLFAAIRERIACADVPGPFRGTPIALVTAGLMSMAFLGFSGFVRG